MALTCPKCEKLNRCDCKNCNPDENPKDLVIIDYVNNLYQCCFCGHKFDEQDSLDFEWDKMHQNFKKSITPEMALHWKILTKFGTKTELKEYQGSIGSYGFESAFFQHFGIRHDNCGHKELDQIKLQLERESKLNKIITN